MARLHLTVLTHHFPFLSPLMPALNQDKWLCMFNARPLKNNCAEMHTRDLYSRKWHGAIRCSVILFLCTLFYFLILTLSVNYFLSMFFCSDGLFWLQSFPCAEERYHQLQFCGILTTCCCSHENYRLRGGRDGDDSRYLESNKRWMCCVGPDFFG